MSKNKLKKIKSSELVAGMFLQELCGSWMNHPFWRSKFVIKDQNDIRLIIDSGIEEVWIDSGKGLDVITTPKVDVITPSEKEEVVAPELSVPENPSVKKETKKHVPIAEELKRAAKLCDESKQAVVSMFQEARMGKAIDAGAANSLVEEISSSVTRNSGALISLARLKTVDDYTYMHSVAVCALMVAVAQRLGMNEKEVREAGMGGLLHDLGKSLMPMDVLNKPGKLTDEEFAIIKKHPEEGHRLLLESNSAGEIPLDICLHHHEKVDGSGYPHRLKDDQISIYSKMGAVCDVYDAITSNRPYKEGWDPAESIRKMSEWSSSHFDLKVFKAFVKSIGIYPVGSLVRLNTGRLGVVIDQTSTSLLTPKIKVFFSTKTNLRIPPEVIDLSKPACKEKILSVEDSAKWNFADLNSLWGDVELF